MANNKKKKDNRLGLMNDAMRNAHSAELARLLRERAKSNASGIHLNPAEKRARTRNAAKAKALKEFTD